MSLAKMSSALTHWQKFCGKLADMLGCPAMDTDVLDAVKRLVQSKNLHRTYCIEGKGFGGDKNQWYRVSAEMQTFDAALRCLTHWQSDNWVDAGTRKVKAKFRIALYEKTETLLQTWE